MTVVGKVEDDALVAALRAIVGDGAVLRGERDTAPFVAEQRGLYPGRARCVVCPASTEQVAAVVAACRAAGAVLVPQGGNTGLVGGSTPDESGSEVLLSLSRMNRLRSLDRLNFTMIVEAGMILAEVQRRADEAGRLFPLSLAAEGSCEIGGNLSTNAGGTAVLRYGNARDLVLGLEVVLADGRIWDGLRTLRKDNTGYDLKSLFLGAEGTLGIITACALKLFPRPARRLTAFVAISRPSAAAEVLGLLRDTHGDQVTTFEYIERTCLDLVFARIPGTRDPLGLRHAHYLLVELSVSGEQGDVDDRFERMLSTAMDRGWVEDAALAASEGQRRAFWRLRESIPEASKLAGAGLKHDIAVPLTEVSSFIDRGIARVREILPPAKMVVFGHLGDGNLHFNINQPEGMTVEAFRSHAAAIEVAIHDLAASLSGSFSAEHGIGRLKRESMRRYKSPVELDLMRRLKSALDPAGLLNPGRVVPQ